MLPDYSIVDPLLEVWLQGTVYFVNIAEVMIFMTDSLHQKLASEAISMFVLYLDAEKAGFHTQDYRPSSPS